MICGLGAKKAQGTMTTNCSSTIVPAMVNVPVHTLPVKIPRTDRLLSIVIQILQHVQPIQTEVV